MRRTPFLEGKDKLLSKGCRRRIEKRRKGEEEGGIPGREGPECGKGKAGLSVYCERDYLEMRKTFTLQSGRRLWDQKKKFPCS